MESVFSIVIGNTLDSLNCLERTLPKDIFLEIYWNIRNRSFSKHPLTNAGSDFFISITIPHSNLLTLIKPLHYRSFLGKFLAISEHWQETFFPGVCFLEAWNSRLQACRAREEETVLQRFFGIFKILEHPSVHFQKSIYNGGFSPVVGCRL